MMNKDISDDIILPFIVKERDRYKEKLETLSKYTKSLERYVAYLENRNNKLSKNNAELSGWLVHLKDK